MVSFYAIGRNIAKRVKSEGAVSYYVLNATGVWDRSDYILRCMLGYEEEKPDDIEISEREARTRFAMLFPNLDFPA